MTEEPSENSRTSLGTIATFTVLGAVNGLLSGLGLLVLFCSPAPSFPARFEVIFLAVLIGILTAGGACLGVLVGFVVSLPRRSE